MSLIERYTMTEYSAETNLENFADTMNNLNSSLFSTVSVTCNDAQFWMYCAKINKDDQTICDFFTWKVSANTNDNEYYLRIKSYGSNNTFLINWNENNDAAGTKYNCIKDIIVGQHFIGINFINDINRTMRTGSVIVLTRTKKNETCIIMPSYGYTKQEYYENKAELPVYLSAITSKTKNDFHTYTKYVSSPSHHTVFTPVLVNGDDDYCPHAFYTPFTEIILDQSDDAIIDYNGKHYWYNGFIAVEI